MIDDYTIEQRFWQFHRLNPAVYAELRRLALGAVHEGAAKLGLRQLWEVMRWNQKSYLPTNDPSQDDYRLNDHYIPHYARLLMREEPELDGVFETRALRSRTPAPELEQPETVDSAGELALFA